MRSTNSRSSEVMSRMQLTMIRLLGALALIGPFGSPAAAQISIHVIDSDGRPIPAVQIDVYGRGELISTESTSALGIAELSSERWSEVQRISLRHLGFRTRIVQADDIPHDGVIRLEHQPIDIEGIDVTVTELCPIDDDPEARRLWSEVASRYSRETGFRALSAYFSRYGDGVRERELHQNPDRRPTNYVFAGHPGVIHGNDHLPRSLDHRIETEGYAWPPLMINGETGGRAVAWQYPELDRAQAYHFASPVFGKLHNFAVARDSDAQATLAFCGNGNASGATINGTVTLIPGEALVSAEWRFRTPDPDEGVGGSVLFASYVEAPGERPHLVAARGLFYRRRGSAPENDGLPRYYGRDISVDQRWYVHQSGDHPCNTGYSLHVDPPTTPSAMRFIDCIAANWERR